MPSVALYTLGCKVSQYETEAVAELFEAVLPDCFEVDYVRVFDTV